MSFVAASYHDRFTAQAAIEFHVHEDTRFEYDFENFFHPLVGELVQRLNRESLAGMLDAAWQKGLAKDFFDGLYALSAEAVKSNGVVGVERHPKEIDVSVGGPYANYNWELLFHVPFTVAVHLSKTQRFAEAQRWFHYVFDPTSTDTTVDPPARFWRFLAFRDNADPRRIEALLMLLSRDPSGLTAAEAKLRQQTIDGYQKVLESPFQPHAVARTRTLAYQYATVMKYLDNLIAWGDSLFQQDTIESINEATQLYVLASNLLGPRPQKVPSRGDAKPLTFAQLRNRPGPATDPMVNPLVELEGQFTFNSAVPSGGVGAGAGADPAGAAPLFGLGRTFYFCVPRNDKMLGYWDAVGDRLFKIRNGMNIAGVMRPQALFDPPIDPGLLVKAAAAGLDLAGVIGGLYRPPGPVRCVVYLQKAIELAGEVRALGSALLAAIEKGDAEHLALVRQRHEVQVQGLARGVRFLQHKAAQEATRSLKVTRDTALERLRYYQAQLGLPDDPNAPADLPIDFAELTEENFDGAYAALVAKYDKPIARQAVATPALAGDSSPGPLSGYSGSGKVFLSRNEDTELNVHLPIARDAKLVAAAANVVATSLMPIPSVNIKLHFWGLGAGSEVTSGPRIAAMAKSVGDIAQIVASWEQDQAAMAARYAGYERRAAEWQLQYNLAAHELMQLGRQILTSLVAEQVAAAEFASVQKQFENSQEVDRVLRNKFSNQELHLWTQGELSRLHGEYYRFALDTARKAEAAVKRELLRPELDAQEFVTFNYFDGGRRGLLAGEALHLDLKRLELAYLESNRRELELTRHVSLRQLDPAELLKLKVTGGCTVAVPEWLFDRDAPGHYLRRIKTVAVTVPCVTGPYTGVHCTLTLVKSSLRTVPTLKDGGYARQGPEDERFVDSPGGLQSVVTSHASNDPGLFEAALRDERLLPFEGAGAVSTWKLDLPKDYAAFDFATITDVILHVRYTARQGVPVPAVTKSLKDQFGPNSPQPLVALFDLRHDFPTAWAARGAGPLRAAVPKDYFPYIVQGRVVKLGVVALAGVSADKPKTLTLLSPGGAADEYTFDAASANFLTLAIPAERLASVGNTPYLLVEYVVS